MNGTHAESVKSRISNMELLADFLIVYHEPKSVVDGIEKTKRGVKVVLRDKVR
jgi:hypothetical protein